MRRLITRSRKNEKAKKRLRCSFVSWLFLLHIFLGCFTFSSFGRIQADGGGNDSDSSTDALNKRREATEIPTFRNGSRPPLEAKCWRCHSGKTRRKDLDLSSSVGILKGSESGPVIIPGKPGESLLYQKVQSGKMPPTKKDHLSEVEVE